MKKLLFSFYLILFSTLSVYAQNVTVSGTITDLSGNPINNQAVYVRYFPFSPNDTLTSYTDNNGYYSFTRYVGSLQQTHYSLRVYDNCGGKGFAKHPQFNASTTGYYLGNNNFSICNTPSNCSVSYTYSQVNNQVIYTPTATGTAPFEYRFTPYVYPSGTSSFSKFYSPSGDVDYMLIRVEDANGCTASYTDTINVLPSSTNPCYTAFDVVYRQPNSIYINTYNSFNSLNSSITYDFGDGTPPVSSPTIKTYTTSGIYNVCVTRTSSNCTFTYCDSVYITVPTTCNAAITSYSRSHGSFSTYGSIGAAPITYSYIYGDGTTGTNDYHIYSANGNYTACVIMTSATGCVDTACTTVLIDSIPNPNLSCSISFSQSNNLNSNLFSFSSIPDSSFQPISYWWDFGDGNTSTLAHPTHNYLINGNYIVCLSATDSLGCTASYCDTVNANNCNLSVDFSEPLSNIGSYTKAFISSVTGVSGTVSYYWDFGDGSTSTQANPTHTYSDTGSYQVCLTVTDSLGCIASFCNTIDAYLCNLSVSFSGPSSNIGSYTKTWVSSVTGANGSISYHWDFGDNSTSTQANPTYTYSDSGFYQICLTVTDNIGCIDSSCYHSSVWDTINNPNCYSDFSYQIYPIVGSTAIIFTANVSGTIPSYAYNWTFSNGNTSNNYTSTQTYTSTGYYQVCLTTTDSANCVSTYCDSIYIQVLPSTCNANFTTYDSLGYTFFVNQSTGTPGTATYTWDFGDGTTSTNYSPVHQYQNAGYYNACLTIIDSTGCTSTYCDTIYSYGIPNCSVTLTHYNDTIFTPTLVHFNAAANGIPPFTYTWDYGDGWAITTNSPYKWRSYAFNDTTIYACVTITDSIGCTSTDCNWVYIPDTTVFNSCYLDFTYQADIDGAVNFTATNIDGVAPYSFSWDMGDASTSSLQNPSHTFPHSGNFWTCVTITDSVGCSYTHCDTVAVPPFTSTNEIKQLMNINVFPNPVNDILNIEFLIEQTTEIQLTVMSVTGQVVQQQIDNYFSGEQQITISTTNLPSGVYLLRLTSDSDVFTRRFVKN